MYTASMNEYERAGHHQRTNRPLARGDISDEELEATGRGLIHPSHLSGTPPGWSTATCWDSSTIASPQRELIDQVGPRSGPGRWSEVARGSARCDLLPVRSGRGGN